MMKALSLMLVRNLVLHYYLEFTFYNEYML